MPSFAGSHASDRKICLFFISYQYVLRILLLMTALAHVSILVSDTYRMKPRVKAVPSVAGRRQNYLVLIVLVRVIFSYPHRLSQS